MKCSKCGAEFEGHFCPNCGAPANTSETNNQYQVPTYQSQPTSLKESVDMQRAKKKKGCLTAAIIVVVFVVFFALLVHSCAGSPPQVVSSGSNAKATQAKNESSEASNEKKTFKVGDVVKYNDIELSITNVRKTKGGEYDSPKPGNEYVIVTVKYKNDGQKNVAYNPYDFRMKNSKGQITSMGYMSEMNKTQLNSGDLAPGGDVSGDIAFEEPQGDSNLTLQYTGNIFISESEIDFKLQ